jgi:di/tricarboxylate transporter
MTLIALTIMIYCLIREIGKPEIVVFLTVSLFIFSGILSPTEALKGFSNEGMLTIALLLIVGGVIQQSPYFTIILKSLLGNGANPRLALLRMMVPVTFLSSFMNNTPIVIMFMAHLREWCQNHNISPSKFLIPLSYASIFGGMITLIGTSTNLVIHGLMIEHQMTGYSMFELAPIALPLSVIAIFYMTTIGYRILPNHLSRHKDLTENKEYLTEAYVEVDSPIIGKTIQEAGLRNLKGLYLIELIRNEDVISPVNPKEKILGGDHLIFTGIVSTIIELYQIKGLRIESNPHFSLNNLNYGKSKLVEAVVSHQSSLLSQTIKQTNFRSKYDAAVIAVHRHHERIETKIGDVQLKTGDTILLLVGTEFPNRFSSQRQDFYLANSVPYVNPLPQWKSSFAISMLMLMIIFTTFNLITMFQAALFTVCILLLFKVISLHEAKNQMPFNILLLIASSFGIGAALEKTGTAYWLAKSIISISFFDHAIFYICTLYLLTNLLTEVMSNSATAVIMFPIAIEMSGQLSIEPLAFIIAITIAASAGFATPIGYQTNLLVYGIGRYRFIDYLKVGLPLNLIYMLLTIYIINMIYLT